MWFSKPCIAVTKRKELGGRRQPSGTHRNIRMRSVTLDWRDTPNGYKVEPRADRDLNKPENPKQTGVGCKRMKRNMEMQGYKAPEWDPTPQSEPSMSHYGRKRSACMGQGRVWEHLCCSGPGTPGSWFNDII